VAAAGETLRYTYTQTEDTVSVAVPTRGPEGAPLRRNHVAVTFAADRVRAGLRDRAPLIEVHPQSEQATTRQGHTCIQRDPCGCFLVRVSGICAGQSEATKHMSVSYALPVGMRTCYGTVHAHAHTRECVSVCVSFLPSFLHIFVHAVSQSVSLSGCPR
jgi:hypothetical protein